MKAWTALRPALDGLICVAALVTGLTLLFGERALRVGAITTGRPSLTSSVILLAALIALRLVLASRAGAARDAALVAALLSIACLANYRTAASGDTIPARYLPFSVLRHGTFYLDELAPTFRGCLPYFARVVDAHYVSAYPVGPAVAALPFYLLPILGGVPASSPFVAELEKVAAAIIVALSAAVLYVAVREMASRRMAVFISVAYGLGSSSFSLSSQALWQHGPAQLMLSPALWALLRARRHPRALGLAGLSLSAGVVCRPPLGLLAVPLAAFVLVAHRRSDHDVFPGERYEFAFVPVQAPPAAGAYELEIGLVIRHRGCLSEIPGAVRRVAVTVLPPAVTTGGGPGARQAPIGCGRSLLTDPLPRC